MPTNVFISFAFENLKQVESIRALAKNSEHELEFHDWSEVQPVKDRAGTPLPYQPDDTRAAPIRKELKRLLNKATKMVVVIGATTHKSKWVNWEIQVFYDQKSNLPGDATKRIKGMYVRKCQGAELPRRIKNLKIHTITWDLTALNKWFNMQPSLRVEQ